MRYKSFEAFTAMKSPRGLSRVRVDLISQRFEECPCKPAGRQTKFRKQCSSDQMMSLKSEVARPS
jgi:hypothetical protein